MARPANQLCGGHHARQPIALAYFCLVLLSTCILGCNSPANNQSNTSKPEDTAKKDFEWVMERLQGALDTSGSVAHLNLRVKRKLSYELLPPEGSRANYAARVTIKSRSDYIPEAPISPKKEGEQQADSESDSGGDPTERLGEDPLAQYDIGPKVRAKKPMIVEPATQFPKIEETNVYELAYLDSRWQLQTQLETEHEQMWFDYALQQ